MDTVSAGRPRRFPQFSLLSLLLLTALCSSGFGLRATWNVWEAPLTIVVPKIKSNGWPYSLLQQRIKELKISPDGGCVRVSLDAEWRRRIGRFPRFWIGSRTPRRTVVLDIRSGKAILDWNSYDGPFHGLPMRFDERAEPGDELGTCKWSDYRLSSKLIVFGGAAARIAMDKREQKGDDGYLYAPNGTFRARFVPPAKVDLLPFIEISRWRRADGWRGVLTLPYYYLTCLFAGGLAWSLARGSGAGKPR